MNDYGKRLKIVRGEMLQEDFAKILDVHKNTLVRFETGKGKPNIEELNRILTAFPDINPAWLLTGEGEMRRGESSSPGADHSGDVTAMVAADPAAPFAQDAESEELCRLLKRYGNRALIEDVKGRLLRIKAVVEG